MSTTYIYIEPSKPLNKCTLDKTLKMLKIEGFDLIQDGNIFILSLYNGEESLIKVQSSFLALSDDLGVCLKGLVTPCLHSCFAEYVNSVPDNQVIYAFELGFTDKNIYRYCLDILKDFDSETLITIKAYIEYGNSPTLSSQRIFVHRNTVTYRINQFSSKTGIDLSFFPNCVFLLELIRKRHAEYPEEYFR